MRLIITGGTGLIGTALAKALAKNGDEVILLSRNPEHFHESLPTGVRLQRWDGKTATGWGDLVSKDSGIINLAGANLSSGRWTSQRKQEILLSRIQAGEAVVQAIQQAKDKPQVLLQSSAVGYYGSRGDETITEKTPAGDDFASQVTIAWEKSTGAVEQIGVRRVIIRTGVVLSQSGGALPQMLLPFRLFTGGPIANGKQWFPWIHMDDEVAAIIFLLQHPDTVGIYNLSAPYPVQNREFAQAIGKQIHRPAALPLPAIALKTMFGEMSSILLASQRVIPQRLLEAGIEFKHPRIELALADILK